MRRTDEEFAKQQERVRSLMEPWVTRLGLEYWTIHRHYYDADIPNHEESVFSCKADWRYLEATIQVSIAAVAEHSDEDLEEAVVHELMHVHLCELQGAAKGTWTVYDMDHEERVATQLTHAFIRTFKAGAKQ